VAEPPPQVERLVNAVENVKLVFGVRATPRATTLGACLDFLLR
jgi:hypothetical protein